MQDKNRLNQILQKTITKLCVFVMVFCFLPINVFAEAIREEIPKEERIIRKNRK